MKRNPYRTKLKHHYEAVRMANNYALRKSYVLCEGWLERAARLKPLSAIQWFNLKTKLGETRLNEIRDRVCPGGRPLWE